MWHTRTRTHTHTLVLLPGYSIRKSSLSAILNLMQPAFRQTLPPAAPFIIPLFRTQSDSIYRPYTTRLSLSLLPEQQVCVAECSSSRPVREWGACKNRTSSPYAWSANEAGMGGGCPERCVHGGVWASPVKTVMEHGHTTGQITTRYKHNGHLRGSENVQHSPTVTSALLWQNKLYVYSLLQKK